MENERTQERAPATPPTDPPILGDEGPARKGPWWIIVPAAVGIMWVLMLWFREDVLHMPLAVMPLPGDRVPADFIDLRWNSFLFKTDGAHAQVATDRRFKNIVFEETCERCSMFRRYVKLEPGASYYWRVRSIREGKKSPWTLPMKFAVKE